MKTFLFKSSLFTMIFFILVSFLGQAPAVVGAAPKPMPIKQLSQQKFLGGLEHLLKTQRYQERTNTLGSLLTAEDGVGNAVKHIETGGQSCCQSASLA